MLEFLSNMSESDKPHWLHNGPKRWRGYVERVVPRNQLNFTSYPNYSDLTLERTESGEVNVVIKDKNGKPLYLNIFNRRDLNKAFKRLNEPKLPGIKAEAKSLRRQTNP